MTHSVAVAATAATVVIVVSVLPNHAHAHPLVVISDVSNIYCNHT